MFFLSAGVQKLQQAAPEASKKIKIDQLSNHGKPTKLWRLSKLPKRNLKNQYHWDFKRPFLTLQDAGKGRDVFLLGG